MAPSVVPVAPPRGQQQATRIFSILEEGQNRQGSLAYEKSCGWPLISVNEDISDPGWGSLSKQPGCCPWGGSISSDVEQRLSVSPESQHHRAEGWNQSATVI